MFTSWLGRMALDAAWKDVLEADAQDGTLQKSVVKFAADSAVRLDELHAALHDASYEPADLSEARIPKSDGTTRLLHVPAVRDRIVERALLRGLTPRVDPHLGQGAFGYRPGLGVADAVQKVATLRDEGHPWVVRTDVDDCFPSLRVPLVLSRVAEHVPDARVLALIESLLARYAVGMSGRHTFAGLPQGSPLSPLFCNLVLRQLDSAVLRAGYPIVRYADDFVITCRSRAKAQAALELAANAVEELEMKLGADKTEIMSFDEGFSFLGEDFGSRYPPVLPDYRLDAPDEGVLYVARQGSRVRITRGRVLVESADKTELLSLPQSHVSRVVCFGSIGVSAGARDWAFSTDTQVIFLSRRGSYRGQLLGANSKTRVSRLRAQLALLEDRAMRIATTCMEGKVIKQSVLLGHFIRDDNADEVAPAVQQIESLLPLLKASTTPAELMGVEGAAARAYFQALRALLPDDLSFSGRNRQPPLDVINAALSYGYTILLGECVSAIVAAGLDPGVGCLHTESRKQPALALDLMEEFRPTIVDQVVVQLARSKALRTEHGFSEPGKPGVLLTKAGKEILMEAYERRMLTRVKTAMPDFAGSWRRHLYRQAQCLAAAITGNEDAFRGLSWR